MEERAADLPASGLAPRDFLGTPARFPYRHLVIGLLRFVGLMNAAVWFGAAVFFIFGADPATSSEQMRDLIGSNNFPYFSEAISSLIARRFFHLYAVCSVIALVYLMAEWLYFGKYPPKWWLSLICVLVVVGLLRGFWIEPSLRNLHEIQFNRQTRVEQRDLAARARTTWKILAHSLDVLLTSGLALYAWRVANPGDAMRFVSASKFRG